MDFFECMESRSSMRAFLPKEVDKSILEKVIKAANRSPSYMNTQPWEVFVATGEKKASLAKKITQQAADNGIEEKPDIPFPKYWPKPMEERAKNHRLGRFDALGINPDVDKDDIRQSFMNNFRFFDAPCTIIVGMQKSFSPWCVFDIGSFVHGLLLGLHAEGLGGVPQAMPTAYANAIRSELDIHNDIFIILTISVGYPDHESPVNQYVSGRRSLDEFVQWYGF